jgi:hypothetical protein
MSLLSTLRHSIITLMLKLAQRVRYAVIVVVLLGAMPASITRADTGCSVGITPGSASATSSATFDLQITNNGTTDIQWVTITVPSNFLYESNNVGDWSTAASDNTSVTFTGNTLGQGQAGNFQIITKAGLRNSSGNWQVQTSDDPGGSSAAECGGDTTTVISGHPPNDSNVGVSNIMVTNITTSSATVTWDSDSATSSLVYYGASSNYGSTSSYNTTLETSHSVTLTGLNPATAYHYQVAGDDGQFGFAYSSNNTFVTKTPSTTSSGSGSSGSGSNAPGVIINPVPTETVPPTITLTTDLSKPFKQTPVITGQASDNVAIAKVEYSIDGGQNWLPVDRLTQATQRGQADVRNVTFQFTPIPTEDGNYPIVARAIDSSNNPATTPVATLIIDRLPPQLGPLVISYGPETLEPQSNAFRLVAGSTYKLVASDVGGSTSITIDAKLIDSRAVTSSFALTQSADSGLWNGLMTFKQGGAYELTVRSLDGAGNKTNRVVAQAAVSPVGRVLSATTSKVAAGAELTLYYQEPTTRAWQIWDGAPYDQANPQKIKADGSYSLMLPQGRYYLKVRATGHHLFVSNIFTLDRPTGLASVIKLDTKPHLTLGAFTLELPSLGLQSKPLQLDAPQATAAKPHPLLGQLLPDFNLGSTEGGTRRSLDFLARPTVISVMATWSPASQAQLAGLTGAQTNRDINVVPVFSQEYSELVSVYLATAGYNLEALVDPDGLLVPALGVGSVPQHIFVDRAGYVKKVMVGVLSKDELLTQLGGL